MNPLATVRVALRALRVNGLRSALTMLGIIIGVGAVITMVAVGSGAQSKVNEQIKSLGSNIIIVLSGSSTQGGARLGFGSQLTISEDDAYALQREVPEIQAAAPMVRGGAQLIYGNQNWSTGVAGITPEYFEVRDWAITEGRMLTPEEVDSAAKVVMIGRTVALNLFGDQSPIDQTMRIKKVPFTVIGVMETKGQSLQGQDQDDIVLIPISTARRKVLGGIQAKQRSVVAINLKVREGFDMSVAESEARNLLRQRHRLQTNQDDDFSLLNLTEVLKTQQESGRILALLLAAVASVSLVVGGIGIMNIMLVSVTERTREIGLRMALGARHNDIMVQFLVEAVTLSLIGGTIGIMIGAVSSIVVGRVAGWPTLIEPASVVLAFGFSGAVGVFFGFYPARKAANLRPIEALRYE